MKKIILFSSVLVLAGCNPFSARQQKTINSVKKADEMALIKKQNHKKVDFNIVPYDSYQYQSKLKDPFRVKEFLAQEFEEESKDKEAVAVCEPPSCVAPKEHPKEFLENYALGALQFVGTIDGTNTALIKTPDFGVMQVKEGNYIGLNDGKVLKIKETSVVIQEKVNKKGLWENKKSVLMIKQ